MADPFVHVELNSPDPEKAKAFYSKLFQWQLGDIPNPGAPDGTYTMIKVGTGTGGGIMKQVAGGPSGWLAYVAVEDIQAATQKAKSLGGRIMKDLTEVPGMGGLSFIQGPDGSILGLWKSNECNLGLDWLKEIRVGVESCIPVIPSADLEKSLRLWVDGLGFNMDTEMHADGKLIFCMLHRGGLTFMLNRRAGTPTKPEDYHGIHLYWAPSDIHETRERLERLGYKVSELEERDYGQTEFFLIDDDGFSHCFGVATRT